MLRDKLRERIINNLFINYYAWDNKETLNFLYNLGVIDDTLIESSFEERVLNEARRDYRILTEKKAYHSPDHLCHPEYLAYAIKKRIFSRRKVKKIPLEGDDTHESFVEGYFNENLLPKLREEFLNPKPPLKIPDSHCACCV